MFGGWSGCRGGILLGHDAEKGGGKEMKKKSGNIIIVCVLAAALLAAQWLGLFRNMEYQFQDARYQTGGLVSPEIYVIGIDEETLMEYGLWSDWGREKTAELVALLNEDEDLAPAVIGLDIGFYSASDPVVDEALIEAASKIDNVVMTSYATFGKQVSASSDGSFQVTEEVQTYEIPFEGLREHVSWGFSNVPLDQDGLVRHSLGSFEVNGEPEYSLASEIYRKYMGELPSGVETGSSLSYIPFSGYPYDYYGSETAGLSFCDVLSGEIPKELFAGCIVLVGAYSTGMMDSYYTAISHDVPMHGVEVHANILQAFLEENIKTEPGQATVMAITLAMFAVTLLAWCFRKMWLATVISAAAVAGYWFVTGLAYENGYVMPILYPMAAAAACYISQIGWQYVNERLAKKHIESVFGRYVPESVVNGIVKGGEDALKLGGQKKDIAVLFVDIRGFTPLSEALDPEQVVAVLNQYLEITTKAVFDNGGTVDKFIGDATMALFNAPLDQDDYVFRAVKTGLDMAAGGRALEKELEKLAGKKVGFGIGINCGEAVIGNIGTAKRMEYTAIGNTVNTAARLESRAKAGEVLISPEVYERLKGRIQVESLGPCTLKGIAEPVEIFRVIGVETAIKVTGMLDNYEIG